MKLTSSKQVLIDFSLSVKAATLIFISGRDSTISFTKQGKSGASFIKAFKTYLCL